MSTRITFSALLPGDVLVHRSNEKDVFMVVRAGNRLDFKHLIDGRFLPAWVAACAAIPMEYSVVRGNEVVIVAA